MGARRWEDISDELEEALDDLYAAHLIVTQVMGRYKKECPQMWEALARPMREMTRILEAVEDSRDGLDAVHERGLRLGELAEKYGWEA